MNHKKKNGSANAKETAFTVDHCANLISHLLSERKFDKDVCTGTISEDESVIFWVAPCESIEILIAILNPRGEEPTVEIKSIVSRLPEARILPFYRRCLEINEGLFEGALSASGKDITLLTQRSLSLLTPEEAFYKINMIFSEAPIIAKELQDEFGVPLQPNA